MSMSICLTIITLNGTRIDKELLHTPTNVTYDILNSDNPMGVYIEYVKPIVKNNDYLKEELIELKKLSEDSTIKLEWSMI